jgi:hypothetical protein
MSRFYNFRYLLSLTLKHFCEQNESALVNQCRKQKLHKQAMKEEGMEKKLFLAAFKELTTCQNL